MRHNKLWLAPICFAISVFLLQNSFLILHYFSNIQDLHTNLLFYITLFWEGLALIPSSISGVFCVLLYHSLCHYSCFARYPLFQKPSFACFAAVVFFFSYQLTEAVIQAITFHLTNHIPDLMVDMLYNIRNPFAMYILMLYLVFSILALFLKAQTPTLLTPASRKIWCLLLIMPVVFYICGNSAQELVDFDFVRMDLAYAAYRSNHPNMINIHYSEILGLLIAIPIGINVYRLPKFGQSLQPQLGKIVLFTVGLVWLSYGVVMLISWVANHSFAFSFMQYNATRPTIIYFFFLTSALLASGYFASRYALQKWF